MNQIEQMLRPLNITPDQEQRIQAIYAEMADERQAATRRLRLAHRALSEAIQSPKPDEALIEQRSKEVADAQATTIRLRSLTEARILQVLTQDQRVKLRQLRAQAMMQRRNQQNPRIFGRGGNALQQNQNRNTPTQRQRRLMRQQPRPQ
jgi:Spy/CpxP family protein refolding chaperone